MGAGQEENDNGTPEDYEAMDVRGPNRGYMLN